MDRDPGEMEPIVMGSLSCTTQVLAGSCLMCMEWWGHSNMLLHPPHAEGSHITLRDVVRFPRQRTPQTLAASTIIYIFNRDLLKR